MEKRFYLVRQKIKSPEGWETWYGGIFEAESASEAACEFKKVFENSGLKKANHVPVSKLRIKEYEDSDVWNFLEDDPRTVKEPPAKKNEDCLDSKPELYSIRESMVRHNITTNLLLLTLIALTATAIALLRAL